MRARAWSAYHCTRLFWWPVRRSTRWLRLLGSFRVRYCVFVAFFFSDALRGTSQAPKLPGPALPSYVEVERQAPRGAATLQLASRSICKTQDTPILVLTTPSLVAGSFGFNIHAQPYLVDTAGKFRISRGAWCQSIRQPPAPTSPAPILPGRLFCCHFNAKTAKVSATPTHVSEKSLQPQRLSGT